MQLEGKTAIITGAGSGFGAGIAERFRLEGAKVIIADKDQTSAKRVAHNIDAIPYQIDVTKINSVREMIKFAKRTFKRIDILVNNAGITHLPAPMENITEKEFDKVLSVNAKSVFLTAESIVPVFKRQKTGVILNIASTAGVSPRPNLTWYNASKGWMITATKTMAVELAPYNVRVNSLAPVAGETPLLKSFLGEDTPERRKAFLSTIPIGRFSKPQDLGNAASFLCSDEANMITGVTLEVDGGRCI